MIDRTPCLRLLVAASVSALLASSTVGTGGRDLREHLAAGGAASALSSISAGLGVQSDALFSAGFRASSWVGPTTAAYARAGRIVCEGDGKVGIRVQAVYLLVKGTPSLARSAASISQGAILADAAFAGTASREGSTRHIRWVTRGAGSACSLDIATLAVTAQAAGDLNAIVAALRAQGFNQADRIYEVWSPVRANDPNLCGQGQGPVGDSPGPGNPANAGNRTAVTWQPCWAMSRYTGGLSVEAHELTHALGAVQASAPHATLGGHCTDRADLMCYDDHTLSTYSGALRCPISYTPLLDCGADDYFAIAPAAGSYLATHWNVADSGFLIGGGSGPPSVDLVAAGLVQGGHARGANVGPFGVQIGVVVNGWSAISAVDGARSADGGATWTPLTLGVSTLAPARMLWTDFSDTVDPGTYIWRVRAQDVTGAWSSWTTSDPLTVAPPRVTFSVDSIDFGSNSATGTVFSLSGNLSSGTGVECDAEYRVIGGAWKPFSGSSACSISPDGSGLVTLSLRLAPAAPASIAYRVTFHGADGIGAIDVFAGVMPLGWRSARARIDGP